MFEFLKQYILIDIPESFILFCIGVSLFNGRILHQWKNLLLGAVVLAALSDFLSYVETSYYLKMIIGHLFIMTYFLWKGYRMRSIAVLLFGLGWMSSVEGILIFIMQALHVDLAIFSTTELLRLCLSYIYLLTLALPMIIFRVFQFDLSKLWPQSEHNRYLLLLVAFGSSTVVTLLLLNFTAMNERFMPQSILIPITHLWFYHLLALILALCTSLLFVLYLKATINRVETETEEPYSQQLNDLTTAVRSIKHDILSHHTVILGYLKMKEYGKIEEYVNSLTAETKQIIDVTEGIRNKTISALLYGKMTQYTRHGIDFQVKVSANASQLDTWKDIDVSKLLGNLLDNAYDATLKMDEGDRYIRLEWGVRSGKEYLSIENSGPTIPRNALPDLFSLGYTTRESGDGGVGLAVVKGLVTKYKGEIDVVSRNEVTRFTITLPAAENGAQKVIDKHESASA
ncbi:sensor histidine kinase [Brevibacillus centrosporus]|uniref:sensor histidine kinase n=1 Tax=Brevibacillus centrosporus TaxID=54910 RepID=UPI002E1A1E0E|nr:ATP-binding protein [Brevibacillus centrosporus]